jgi:hypothetical protein
MASWITIIMRVWGQSTTIVIIVVMVIGTNEHYTHLEAAMIVVVNEASWITITGIV